MESCISPTRSPLAVSEVSPSCRFRTGCPTGGISAGATRRLGMTPETLRK
jgi:hypothetical protein